MALSICIIIFVFFIILGIINSLYFIKMLKILVKKGERNIFYYYWKLWLSFSYFKKFINEYNFDSKQKEQYIMLYRHGKYSKICVLIMFMLAILTSLLYAIYY